MKKWRPNKTQARKFAQSMQDPQFAADYYRRKEARAEKRRSASIFDYTTAGGCYIVTDYQHRKALQFLQTMELTDDQREACNQVVACHAFNEKCNHDYIHIVNEMIRNENTGV